MYAVEHHTGNYQGAHRVVGLYNEQNGIDTLDQVMQITRLKEHLMLSRINHKIQIMNQPTLKDAHIYCVINNISAQKYGPLLERYIINKYKYTKNNASDCVGDCSKCGDNIEVKASLGGANHKKFNYVQLRISQNVQTYILTAYYLTLDNVSRRRIIYIQGSKRFFENPNFKLWRICPWNTARTRVNYIEGYEQMHKYRVCVKANV